ncbi:MAG TPA: hypothetical protein VI278_03740 [Nitrososphaeraceae archaeon]
MGDKVTHNRILKRCRDIFKAKDDWTDSGNDKTRALRFDKEIILKVGSAFEVIPEIKILHKDDNDAKDDQTIWKDWDMSNNNIERASEDLAEDKVDSTSTTNMASPDNYNSLVSTAAYTSISNKATGSEVVGKGAASTTMTPTDTASIPAAPTLSFTSIYLFFLSVYLRYQHYYLKLILTEVIADAIIGSNN